MGLARNNWSECPYVGKLAEMLATKLSDYKMIPIDEYSLDNLTPQKRAQINEQLRTQQIQLMDFNKSLDADESRVSKEWLLQSNIEQFDDLIGEMIATSVEENNPNLLHVAYSIYNQMKTNNLISGK